MQIEDRFARPRLVDLRQRLAVGIHVFPDEIAGAVIFPDQNPAGTVHIMDRVPARDFLRAGRENYLQVTRTKAYKPFAVNQHKGCYEVF